MGGGINGSFSFDLHDPTNTGKVRLSDILSDIENNDLFDVSGEITASFFAFAQIGFSTPFGFVGTQFNYNLASTVLFSIGQVQRRGWTRCHLNSDTAFE